MMDALQYSVRQKEMWTINFLTRPINIICSYKYTEGYNLVLLDGNQIKDLPLKYLIFYRLCFNKYWPHGQQWLIILSGNRGRYWMQQQGKRDNFRISKLFLFSSEIEVCQKCLRIWQMHWEFVHFHLQFWLQHPQRILNLCWSIHLQGD